MKYGIVTTYGVSALNNVDLGDKTWDDVEDWYVKWSTLHVQFKGSDEIKDFILSEYIDGDSMDWKRPSNAQIFELNESEDIDWINEIDSQSD